MASEASLEHSLLDVITVSRPLKVRPARAAFHIALRRFEKVRLAKRPLANLTLSNRANSPPRLEVKFPRIFFFEKYFPKKIFEK